MTRIAPVRWDQLQRIPKVPGVYAWYYTLRIPRADLDTCTENISRALSDGDFQLAKDTVRQLIMRHVVAPLAPLNCEVSMHGPLTPTYRGTAQYQPQLSSALLERLVTEPGRLEELRRVLPSTTPGFVPPLYVGMAKDLRVRISQHRYALEGRRALSGREPLSSDERTFAAEVRARQLRLTDLSVVYTEAEVGSTADVENLINRAVFPALGRK